MRSSFCLICLSIILLCTSCNNSEQQYKFPLIRSDVEKALYEQELDWLIKYENYTEDSQSRFTLKNNDNITFGISSVANDKGNILSFTWLLPNDLDVNKFNEFYNTKLPKFVKLVGIFYGNSNKLNSSLSEFIEYYLNEDYEGGVYWTERIGDDHLVIEIKPWLNSQDNRNRLGTLMVTSSNAYEDYLKLLNESWTKTAEIDNIAIIDSTVSEISKISKSTNIEENQSKHFRISGHLEDIREIKTVPKSLKNIRSNFLKANRDKYLRAKLIDETGSIDVFVQNTSLNDNDLRIEREHNVVLYFYEDTPIIVVRYSILRE